MRELIIKPARESEQHGERRFQKKYRNLALVSLAIIIVVVILVSPIVPIQCIVTKTRTRNLRYSSQLYDKIVLGNDVGPWFVNVTNTDSIDGSFSVTMNKWYNTPLGQRQLEDTSTQSSFISAGDTNTFYLPSDWIIIAPMYSFTYSVSAPSTQETYNVTQTEYKSILDWIIKNIS